MALEYTIIRTVEREKALEYWLRITDGDSGALIADNYIFQPHSAVALPALALAALIKTQVLPQFEEAPEEPEISYTAEQVAEILIEKGYLKENDTFPDDLPLAG